MTAQIIDPAVVADRFRDELQARVLALPEPIVLVGLLTAERGPSRTYAEYTRKGCESVGIRFDLRQVTRLDVERVIREVNADAGVHGVFVYYPVFGTEQDHYVRDLVAPHKDIEGLSTHWTRHLYENRRFVDPDLTKKAVLPCTPLAVLKLVEAAGGFVPEASRPLEGRRVCIFNRSEVVGRPLASMMAHDGAEVVSIDVDGPQLYLPPEGEGSHRVRETTIDRSEALGRADIVVTGVPSRAFELVKAAEIRDGAICVNFSTFKNFDPDVLSRASAFVPRVGPMTVTMALRNTLRLYDNERRPAGGPDSKPSEPSAK